MRQAVFFLHSVASCVLPSLCHKAFFFLAPCRGCEALRFCCEECQRAGGREGGHRHVCRLLAQRRRQQQQAQEQQQQQQQEEEPPPQQQQQKEEEPPPPQQQQQEQAAACGGVETCAR